MQRWLYLILLTALWAPSFVFIKVGLRDIEPLTLATGRIVIAAALLFIAMKADGASFPRDGVFWRKFAIMGLLANALPFSLLMLGEVSADSSTAAIFNGFTPIGTAIIANFAIAEEKMTPMVLAGVIAGFLGISLMFIPAIDPDIITTDALPGLIAFTVMALSYSFSIVYARRSLRGYPRFVGPTAQLATAMLMLLPVTLLLEGVPATMPGGDSLFALIWLGVIATALAYIVYYRLFEIASATFVSLVTFFIPPVGVILGAIFLSEMIEWWDIGGLAMILLGARLVTYHRRGKAMASPPESPVADTTS